MSKGENFIHLKFEHGEAVQSKKDILSSEIDLVNIMQSLNNFIALRATEHKLKAKLYREMKRIVSDIKKLEKALPDFDIPRILKHPGTKKREREEFTFSSASSEKKDKNADLEAQLMEIQRKLRQLSG